VSRRRSTHVSEGLAAAADTPQRVNDTTGRGPLLMTARARRAGLHKLYPLQLVSGTFN
jgi:hypothetical protein